MIRTIVILSILALWLALGGCAYDGECCAMDGKAKMACCENGECEECEAHKRDGNHDMNGKAHEDDND